MKLLNKMIVKALAGSALLSVAGSTLATEVTVQASTTVDNAIDLTVAGTLNFGTVRAVVGSADGDCAGLTLPAEDGQPLEAASGTAFTAACTAPSDAVLIAVDNSVERPEFTVAGLAPFTNVTLSAINGGTDGRLEITGAPSTIPWFVLTDWTAYQSSGFSPAAIDLTTTGNIAADSNGEIVFTVGATLQTAATPTTDGITAAYQEEAHEGEFTVEVVY
ncbi:hypothetical protein GTH32_11025 [Alteromonas sp. 345S023]|uniref:DUF4402 domain-containing protein n=1 Tax=Alteromonas profundi TaxID=2696062 RepID=A0A7X5LLT5_9ALTE|nr:hypothetical protein [Alteromonas profundi]NDV91716.1 hypothetical protein [Alteromonas profundi]